MSVSSKWSVEAKWHTESKWQVLALGEDQQAGGVGATLPGGRDGLGPNPDGPNFDDNSQNSYEQEVSFQKWVDKAVDLLNRGTPNNLILAELEHAGCPDPEGALRRAMEQPPEEPEMPQTPMQSQVPSADAQDATTNMQPPQQVAAKTYETLWGQRVAIDERTEEIDPYEEIHNVLNQIEELPEPTNQLEAKVRINLLSKLHHACRNCIAKYHPPMDQAMAIDKLSADAQVAILDLSGYTGLDKEYLASQPKFQYNAFQYKADANEEQVYDEDPVEAGKIFAEELDPLIRANPAEVAQAAQLQAAYVPAKHRLAFVRAAVDRSRECEVATYNVEATQKTASVDNLNDGPAEGLFI